MRKPSARILTNRCDIYRNTSAQDADGGPQFTYPAVPSLAGQACSVQYRDTGLDEQTFGRLTVVNIYHIIFAIDPKLKPRDRVVWTDPSPNRTLFVESNPPSEAGRRAAFVVRAVERV
jgi:hypothetical protein